MHIEIYDEKGNVLGRSDEEAMASTKWLATADAFTNERAMYVPVIRPGQPTRFAVVDNGGITLTPGQFAEPLPFMEVASKMVFLPRKITIVMNPFLERLDSI